MPEQRTLREVHVLRDRRGGDLAGVLRRRQLHYGVHGGSPALICGQVFGKDVHKNHKVSNLLLSYLWNDGNARVPLVGADPIGREQPYRGAIGSASIRQIPIAPT